MCIIIIYTFVSSYVYIYIYICIYAYIYIYELFTKLVTCINNDI